MNDPKVTQAPLPDETPKQPYEKPAVIYRAPLEATAGVCAPPGKESGTPGCNPVQS